MGDASYLAPMRADSRASSYATRFAHFLCPGPEQVVNVPLLDVHARGLLQRGGDRTTSLHRVLELDVLQQRHADQGGLGVDLGLFEVAVNLAEVVVGLEDVNANSDARNRLGFRTTPFALSVNFKNKNGFERPF